MHDARSEANESKWRARKSTAPENIDTGAHLETITQLFGEVRGGKEDEGQDFLRGDDDREFSVPRRSTVRTLNFYCDPFSVALAAQDHRHRPARATMRRR